MCIVFFNYSTDSYYAFFFLTYQQDKQDPNNTSLQLRTEIQVGQDAVHEALGFTIPEVSPTPVSFSLSSGIAGLQQ